MRVLLRKFLRQKSDMEAMQYQKIKKLSLASGKHPQILSQKIMIMITRTSLSLFHSTQRLKKHRHRLRDILKLRLRLKFRLRHRPNLKHKYRPKLKALATTHH